MKNVAKPIRVALLVDIFVCLWMKIRFVALEFVPMELLQKMEQKFVFHVTTNVVHVVMEVKQVV